MKMSVKFMNDLPHGAIDDMWDLGYRPYEVYLYNSKPETVYFIDGQIDRAPAGTVSGWDIQHIFAIKDELKNYPFFDCIILGSDVASCETYWIE
jgi:hypothetical protein